MHTAIGVGELAVKLNSEAARWSALGIQLDVDINTIKDDATAAVCLYKTLDEWLKSGDATHDALIEALKSPVIGHNGLGRNLDTPGSQLTLSVDVSSCTVKTFGLLQPYFGHLSCMPVVCVTHYKLQRDASYLNQSV